jgi:hypothetical protein
VQEKNVTVTLIKPEKEKWHKGANKTWVVEKKYKGLTVSTQLVEPAIIGGPLYDKLGERYVCYFPGITPQPSAVSPYCHLQTCSDEQNLKEGNREGRERERERERFHSVPPTWG